MTIGNGTRSSAAYAYLAPTYSSRDNLHVVVNHRVTKLLENGLPNAKEGETLPDFRTVVFNRVNSSTY